jgi:hypothetical protein
MSPRPFAPFGRPRPKVPHGPPLSVITQFSTFSVTGGADEPVLPGQPISLSIFFTLFDNRLNVGQGATIRVFLPNASGGQADLLLTLPNNGTLPVRVDDQFGWRSLDPIVATIAPPAPFTSVGARLYRIGQQQLRIEITTTGADSGPYVGTAWMTVVPEAVDSSWWLWHPADPTSAEWKEPYSLSGNVENKSLFSPMDFVVTLHEKGPDGDHPSGALGITVPLDDNAPVTFPSITQPWDWFIPGIAVTSDVHHTFEYTVAMNLTDGYRNSYSALSSPHNVFVRVSQKKLDYADASMTTGWLGILASALSFFGVATGHRGRSVRDRRNRHRCARAGSSSAEPPLRPRGASAHYSDAVDQPSGSSSAARP